MMRKHDDINMPVFSSTTKESNILELMGNDFKLSQVNSESASINPSYTMIGMYQCTSIYQLVEDCSQVINVFSYNDLFVEDEDITKIKDNNSTQQLPKENESKICSDDTKRTNEKQKSGYEIDIFDILSH